MELDQTDKELLVESSADLRVCENWILDSGCSFHMTPNRDWFSTYELVHKGAVLMGNNASFKVVGIGIVRIKMFDEVVCALGGIKHVTDLKRNLISLSTLDAKGYKYTGEGGVLKINKGALVVMKGYQKIAMLYVLQGSIITGDAIISSHSLSEDDITKLWHMCLGHMSENGMAELRRRGLLDGKKTSKLQFCENRAFGKQKRVRFSSGIHKSKGPLDYLHLDVWGPAKVSSMGGTTYMLTIVDDFSRKVWVFFLKQKSDVFSTFKDWKTMIKKKTGRQVKCLCTDNELKFCFDEFNTLCKKEVIVRHRTICHTPQQNGVAERMNRTLMQKVRCMLSNAQLLKSFRQKPHPLHVI